MSLVRNGPLLALSIALFGVTTTADSFETVRTDLGSFSGVTSGTVLAFKGIPYAKPPVGALRWRAPQPAQSWSGVRKADAFAPECMQPDDVKKSEDCLYLNVWRPANSARGLPVMVWIYGGALVHGQTSLYPGDRLAAQGIIVVSMNYRMGRLGFFAFPALAGESPQAVRENYGYLDQLAALKWVHRNIAAFGGDPAKVTIAGESAGGGSVLTMLTSPMARGLFRATILESPGIPSPREGVLPLTSLADAQSIATAYAASLGIRGTDLHALAMLRNVPATTLTEGTTAQAEIAYLSGGPAIPGISGAILDGRLESQAPDRALLSGQQAPVPVLIGSNDADLGVGRQKAGATTKDALFAIFGPFASRARAIYDPSGSASLETLREEVFADRTMAEPELYLADAVTRSGHPVYLYRYSYVPQAMRTSVSGVAHGLEVPFVFDVPEALAKDKTTDADREIAATTSAYWVSFVKTGNPNGGMRPTWPVHQAGSFLLLNFTNSGPVDQTDPYSQRIALWQTMWKARVARP
jgi:para-nitrobenzyl esterase